MHNEANAKHEVLLLTADEAAKALRIGARTLWRLTDNGEIPVVKIGRSVRYDIDDLKAWIQRAKRGAGACQAQAPDPNRAN